MLTTFRVACNHKGVSRRQRYGISCWFTHILIAKKIFFFTLTLSHKSLLQKSL
jgi:hypothetical protein